MTIAYAVNTVIFVPVYIGTGLVPRRSISSPEAILIWMATAVIAAGSLFLLPVPYRVVLFIVSSAAIAAAFLRMISGIGRSDADSEENRPA